MRASRASSASSMSGSPAAMVFVSTACARLAMPEDSAMTSGEDLATARLSCARAPLSPVSAFSERSCSSNRRSLVSSEISSTPGFVSGTSVLSFMSVVAGSYQVGPYKDLRGFR